MAFGAGARNPSPGVDRPRTGAVRLRPSFVPGRSTSPALAAGSPIMAESDQAAKLRRTLIKVLSMQVVSMVVLGILQVVFNR
jgi:hypothetical protein